MKTILLIFGCGILGICLGSGIAFVQVGGTSADATIIPVDTRQPSLPRAGEPPPVVQVDNTSYDFGAMERGTTMSQKFRFTNVGTGRLKLSVGDTTCKCAVGKVPGDLIKPGQSVPVRLEWTATTQSPKFRQSATIFTNDPHQRRITLTVSGLVSQPTSVSPPDLHFDKVQLGQSKTAEVYVLSHHVDQFAILDYEFVGIDATGHLDVSIDQVDRDELPDRLAKAGYRVRVTVKETAPFGAVRGWLRIATDLEKAEKIDIPLSVRVVTDISIFGNLYNEVTGVLRLGAVRSSAGIKAKLLLLIRGEHAEQVSVHVVERSPDYLVAELGEPRLGTVVQIPLTVRISPGSPPAAFVGGSTGKLGRIVLETTHPHVPRLEIGVRFTIEN